MNNDLTTDEKVEMTKQAIKNLRQQRFSTYLQKLANEASPMSADAFEAQLKKLDIGVETLEKELAKLQGCRTAPSSDPHNRS